MLFANSTQMCVGWHVFRIPSPDSETVSSDGSSWPSPETDPLEYMPGLRSVVEKHPYAHFFIFSHFNEQGSVVACFLLVRSFPVGVDRAFDRAVRSISQAVCMLLKLLTFSLFRLFSFSPDE
jgi:hypothetical protein